MGHNAEKLNLFDSEDLGSEDFNTYTGIAEYYDELMTAGYYDYEKIGKSLIEVLAPRKKLLELGVGTGLVAEQLLKMSPDLEITGIDNTKSMIEQAQKRLGDKMQYHLADITKLDMQEQFEAAFSVGGCWYFIDNGDHLELCSHIDDPEISARGLEKVINHLLPGGLLAFALQPAHKNYSEKINAKLTYTQEIYRSLGNFTKRYLFEKEGEIVGEQYYKYLVFSAKQTHKFFDQHGLSVIGLDPTRKFFVYKKR